MRKRLIRRFYLHMCKHYHAYSFAANGMVAIAMAGLTLLGIMNGAMTVAALLGWGVLFAFLFALGKWLDQEVEDIDKVADHTPKCSAENEEDCNCELPKKSDCRCDH